MKSLYRRYRPTKLTEVVGQPQVTEPLIKALKQGKISHAYLFIGPRGCGKTSVARILAHEVNAFKYEIEDDYVDIIEIDGASNRGIDNIRELREKVAIAPSNGKYKVYIIDEVHMLTKEAFNALLKTLEEPPTHAIFIMATTDAYKVPITITSRAQTYTFNLADSSVMLKHLKDICKKEKINITDDALEVIVKRGGGSFRDSLSLLDQLSSLSEAQITKEMVINAMGLPQDDRIQSLLDGYINDDTNSITEELKTLFSSGIKPETLVEELIGQIIERPEPRLLPLLAKLSDIKAPFVEAKLLVALLTQSQTQIQGLSQFNRPMRMEERPQPQQQLRTQSQPQSRPQIQSRPQEISTPVGSTSSSFDWNVFSQKVQELNDAVYSQLMKTSYELIDGTLHIYPRKRIIKTILSRDNNKKILVTAAGGIVKITIHDENDTPSNVEEDDMLSKMSAIMGGEVSNDGGGNPFE